MEINNQQVIVFEIKENKKLKWKKWCSLLRGVYLSEVTRSLIEEKVEHEMFILFFVVAMIYKVYQKCITCQHDGSYLKPLLAI